MDLLKRTSIALIIGAIVLLAVAMGGVRFVVSNLEYFKDEVDYLLRRDVHQGITFDRVGGSMNRFNPILRIENVSINLPDRSQPVVVDRLEVEFDFWGSLRERAPVALEITGQLEKLELTKDESGRWLINEYQIGAGAGEVNLPGFSRLLELLPRYVKLDLRQLVVHDLKHQATHQLDQVAARINHRGGQFFTQVSAELPDEFGRSFLLKSVVDPGSSLIYLNTTELQLAPLARLFDADTHGIRSAVLDGELWVEMSGYRLTAVDGNLVLKQAVLQVTEDKEAVTVDYNAHFNATSDGDGWNINSKVDRLGINGRKVPGFRAQVRVPVNGDKRLVSAWIDRLQLSSLPVIAGQWLPNTVSQPIEQGRLKGMLTNLVFEMDLDQPQLARLSMQAIDLSSQRFDKIPGATNLNADLVIGDGRLSAQVHGEEVSLDFGDFFRAPLYFDSVSMDAVLDLHPSGNLLLAADNIRVRNSDAKIDGRLRLEADGRETPFMFLRASFSDAQPVSAGKYIPLPLMPVKTIEWLDRGIRGGVSPAGDLQYHGRLRHMKKLEYNREGEFFVDFDVEDAEVFFAPGWLPARNGNGRVVFHNMGVEFDLDSASYENLDGVRAQGRIADFSRASLELGIDADAATGDALRIWKNTPVGQRFSDLLDELHDLDGGVSTDIEILLPLSKTQTEQSVTVNVDFKNAALRADNWGLDISQLTGHLEVTEDSLEANDVSARFFGDPVEIDAIGENTRVNTRVIVKGNIETSNLLRKLPPQFAQNINGSSNWVVRVDVAGDSAPAQSPRLRIDAASNMKQARIDFPAPLRKAEDDFVAVSTRVDFHPRDIRFIVGLGEEFRARGMLDTNTDTGYRLEQLEIAFADELRGNASPGINLHGRITELHVDEWIKVFSDAGQTEVSILNTVDLDIASAQVFGRRLDTVDFSMHRTDDNYHASIDASLIRGNITAPRNMTADNPLIVDLDYLLIDKLEQDPDYSSLTPSDIPPIHLSSDRLRYHDMSFSDLAIEAGPEQDTLVVNRFDLRRDAIQLTSTADWSYDALNASHLSSIDATIEGEQLGEAISGLGFGDSMTGGRVDFKGSFTWPASLFGFSLENMAGSARMKIYEGVLNNVEPGNGRFVGLFSLTAIPRRLSLDFSDVLVDAMDFDKIDGDYRIANGILFTDNTRLEGPAAKIKMNGKTGIIARNYDQRVRVTPKLRHTIPIVGAVAAGTTVGWSLLLLQNLFKKTIDDAFEIEYRIYGSWDDPQIELIKAVDENRKPLPRNDK